MAVAGCVFYAADVGVPRLVVTRAGHRGLPIILVHDLGRSRRDFDRLLPLLAREHLVVAFDLRGHGRSAGDAPGTDDIGADIEQSRRRAGIDGPYGLLAHGHTAAVALRYACTRPEVAGVVLVDGAYTSPRRWVDREHAQRLVTDAPRRAAGPAAAEPWRREIERPLARPQSLARDLAESLWELWPENDLHALRRPALLVAPRISEAEARTDPELAVKRAALAVHRGLGVRVAEIGTVAEDLLIDRAADIAGQVIYTLHLTALHLRARHRAMRALP